MDLFEKYYHQHFDYVYRYLYLRLGNPQAAEDVTSKTFLTAFEHQKQYDPQKGSWQQWITGVARHSLLDYWKKEKIPLSLEEMGQAEHLLQSLPGPAEKLDKKLMLEAILESMSPTVRRLLILRYVDDLTYQEIAKLTGKTPAAVRKLFSRLQKSLKAQFQQHDLTF